MPNVISNAEKERLVAVALETPGGRKRLASTMMSSLRTRRDYTSVLRKAFLVDELPDGVLPIYDKDPDATAYVVGEMGENILAVQKPRRVHFPLFEIASNPEIPLSQIKERRYDLVTRSQELAKSQIQAAEDERGFSIMDAVAVNGFDSIPGQSNPDLACVAPITPSILADAWGELEANRIPVGRAFLNPRDYTDIRKFGRDILDTTSQRDLLRSGKQSELWGAELITSSLVPQGFIYVCGEADLFGRVPVRTELSVISADDPKNRLIGFSCFENLGIGAHNPLGLIRIVVAR